MIRTITLNTGFDEVFTVSGVTFGGVEEVLKRAELAAGKGINAARTAHALGQPVVAYGLVGAEDEEAFRDALLADGVTPVLVEVSGRTRRNLTLLPLNDHRPAAHFRARGFDLHGTSAVPRLIDLVAAQVEPGDVVTINGSVPHGAGPGTWTALAEVALRARAGLIVDVYGLGAGDALLAGLVAALAEDAGWEAACERGLSVAGEWVAGRGPSPLVR